MLDDEGVEGDAVLVGPDLFEVWKSLMDSPATGQTKIVRGELGCQASPLVPELSKDLGKVLVGFLKRALGGDEEEFLFAHHVI